MTFLSTPALRCGGPQNLPHSTVLNAGPLSALLEQGELRRVMLGNVEVVRRVYVGLRGPDWAAIPAVISELKIQANGQDFSVSYVVQNKQGDFDFTWKIFIGGNPSGQIEFRADGTSHGNFKYNRASICVLHPLRECIGKKMQWRDSQGLPHEGQFPESINPHQPFLNTESILYELQPGLKLSLKYTGDEFEMEDQRNWSDGSFKTYSPPQARPKPFQATVGWKTSQTVSLDLLGSLPPINQNSGLVTFKVNAENITHLPHIGFGVSSAHRRSSAKDISRIKKLSPQHLRASLRLLSPQYLADLTFASAESQALDVPLEVALVIPDGETDQEKLEQYLSEFIFHWRTLGANAVRWFLFSETRDAINPKTFFATTAFLERELNLRGTGSELADNSFTTQFVIGSKSDFVLLNRNRPDQILAHDNENKIGLAFGITPQVHLTDNRTLVEALEGQSWNLRTAYSLWPNKNLFVTPITLKRSPFVQAIKKPVGSTALEQWKSQVDARQFSLFAAGWTLSSLKRIAFCKSAQGLDAQSKSNSNSNPNSNLTTTYYETHGLLGLIAGEGEGDLRVPGTDFEIKKNWVFPVYHIFADFAEFLGGTLVDVESNSTLKVDAIKLINKNKTKSVILIANLDSGSLKFDLKSFGIISSFRRLNEFTAREAIEFPELYRTKFTVIDSSIINELELLPFEVIRLELE